MKIIKAQQENRTFFEKGNCLIYGLEFSPQPDFIYYRNGGLNQVLCAIAKRKNVTIGFAINLFQQAKNKKQILGRMQQNYRLCKKYGVKIFIGDITKDSYKQNKILSKSFEEVLKKKSLY